MSEIYHHGVKGMKWGVRRYQNKDGSLTSTGKKRRKNNLMTEIKESVNRSSANYHESKAKQVAQYKDFASYNLSRNTGKSLVSRLLTKTNAATYKMYEASERRHIESGKKAISRLHSELSMVRVDSFGNVEIVRKPRE